MNRPGVDYIGTIPAEIQLVQVFSSAVFASSKEPRMSKLMVEFLASRKAEGAIRKSGMEPVSRR